MPRSLASPSPFFSPNLRRQESRESLLPTALVSCGDYLSSLRGKDGKDGGRELLVATDGQFGSGELAQLFRAREREGTGNKGEEEQKGRRRQ